jgi:predicted unusual protein kinase regulating ubiquinone biosynthesis (AarF/ABC1/UbiB family)
MLKQRSGLARFLTVIGLFLKIFLAFYSLKYKKFWHKRAWIESKKEELYVSQAHRFRITAVELGGLLIKLGQFFSTRVDVLPQSSIRELAYLQDEIQPVSFSEIKMVIEEEFSTELNHIFAVFNEKPIASASLGQVHKALLNNDRLAAVKILRPGIEELVKIDLRAIKKVIDFIKRFTSWGTFIDFDAIYEEFYITIQDEMNYLKEGKNAETIAGNSKKFDIIIPEIIWEYTTRRVLTMEYVEGIKITDYEELKKAQVDLHAVAKNLLKIYIEQILVDGFYHADPHPGNLFVTPEGKLIMVDFGMVGSISPELRDTLVKLVISMVKRDYVNVIAYLKNIGFLRYDIENEAVTRAIEVFLEQVLGSGTDLSDMDLKNLLNDLEKLLYEQPFQVPANFTFLGRALGTLYGICVGLSPDINFLDDTKPYLEKFIKKDEDILQLVKEKARLWGTSVIEIPPLTERVLRRAERGDLNLKTPVLQEEIAKITRAIKFLAWAVIFGFSLTVSAYLFVNQQQSAAIYSFIFTLVIFIVLLKNSRSREKHRKAPHPPVMVRRGRE